MVEENKPVLNDDLLLETLDNLPRISVPGIMLPNIMDQVMDEHIRSQVRSTLVPVYLLLLGILFWLVSSLSPSDLSGMEFGGLLFSASESGILSVFHRMMLICWQLFEQESGRALLLQGLSMFAVFVVSASLLFYGLRIWIKRLHARPPS